jgi:hypothetical protein
MRRLFKQLIIAGIYFGIAFGAITLISNTMYVPTCADEIRNQDETGIDCGGPCDPCDVKTLKPPVAVKKAFFASAQGNTVDVAFLVKNPNPKWGAHGLSYQIDFLDASGAAIPGSLYGTTHLLPGQAKWIIELAKFASEDVSDVRIALSTSTAQWLKLRPYVSEQNFPIKDIVFKKLVPPQAGYAELTGTISNRSGFETGAVDINVLLYDRLKRIIGIGKTTLARMAVNETRNFRTFWPRQFSDEIESWDVFVDLNLLDNQNFLQKYQM